MMEFLNLSDFKIDEEGLERLAGKVLKEEEVKEAEVSVAFLKKDKMRGINKIWREEEKATDVLSFPFRENAFPGPKKELGQIFICPEVVKERGDDFENDLRKTFIHGLLHLLGYNHKKEEEAEKMKKKEKVYNQS